MDRADVKGCSACRGAHKGQTGTLYKAGRTTRLRYTCPVKKTETTTAISAGAARTSDEPPAAKPEAAKRPTKEATMTQRDCGPGSRRYPITIGQRYVVDADDRPLWHLVAGLVDGLDSLDGDALGTLQGASADAARSIAALQARADADRLRYEGSDQTEHGAGGGQDAIARELGRQVAPVLVRYLVSRRRNWDSLRPAVLDGRSALETGADWLVGGAESVVGLLPDFLDPSLPGSGSAVGGGSAPADAGGLGPLFEALLDLGTTVAAGSA